MKCNDCDARFLYPETVQTQEYRIGNGSENWQNDEYTDICPICGSGCIEEDDEDFDDEPTDSRVCDVINDILKS